MTRTYTHRQGDTLAIKKNHAGSVRVPRKEWKEGMLNNKVAKRKAILEEIESIKATLSNLEGC